MYGHCSSVEVVRAGRLEMSRSSEAGKESTDKLCIDAKSDFDELEATNFTLIQLDQGLLVVSFPFAACDYECSSSILLRRLEQIHTKVVELGSHRHRIASVTTIE